MKVAILGGSFDPPHLGHLMIALQVKELLKMDEVWLMPAFHHPFARDLSDINVRLAMTKKLEGNSIKVSDYEVNQNQNSYTIDTLEGLKKIHPNTDFYWIMGSDQLEHFQKYKGWQDIIAKHNVIIFPREWMLKHLDEIVKEKLQLRNIPQNVIVLQSGSMMLTSISSTKIRQRVKEHLPVHYFLPDGVEELVIKSKLYEK